MGLNELLSMQESLSSNFSAIVKARDYIYDRVQSLAPEKKLKGDEVVGWLGEVYGKLLFGGTLIGDASGFEQIC